MEPLNGRGFSLEAENVFIHDHEAYGLMAHLRQDSTLFEYYEQQNGGRSLESGASSADIEEYVADLINNVALDEEIEETSSIPVDAAEHSQGNSGATTRLPGSIDHVVMEQDNSEDIGDGADVVSDTARSPMSTKEPREESIRPVERVISEPNSHVRTMGTVEHSNPILPESQSIAPRQSFTVPPRGVIVPSGRRPKIKITREMRERMLKAAAEQGCLNSLPHSGEQTRDKDVNMASRPVELSHRNSAEYEEETAGDDAVQKLHDEAVKKFEKVKAQHFAKVTAKTASRTDRLTYTNALQAERRRLTALGRAAIEDREQRAVSEELFVSSASETQQHKRKHEAEESDNADEAVDHIYDMTPAAKRARKASESKLQKRIVDHATSSAFADKRAKDEKRRKQE